MEDACVIADALQHINKCDQAIPVQDRIQAAFHGFEAARRERFEAVLTTSFDTFSFWSDLWRPDLSSKDIEQYEKDASERFTWMWDADISRQGRLAVAEMEKVLMNMTGANGHMNGDVK